MLVLKWQLYPWTHRELARRVQTELGLPVDSPRALQPAAGPLPNPHAGIARYLFVMILLYCRDLPADDWVRD